MQTRRLVLSAAVIGTLALASSVMLTVPASGTPQAEALTTADSSATTADLDALITHLSTLAADDPTIFEWENTFGEAVATIEQRFPTDFAGSSVDPGWSSGEVRFKGLAPSEARDLLDGIDNVRIVENAGYNASDLDHYLDDVLDAAAAEFEPGTTLAALVNDAEKAVNVYATGATGSSTRGLALRGAQVREAARATRARKVTEPAEVNAFDDFSISLNIVDADAITTQASDGGGSTTSRAESGTTAQALFQ